MAGRLVRTVVVAAWLFAAIPDARAVDGVIEINEARALHGGVTASDTPGFPVTLAAPGSYRLTSDLAVPEGESGIAIADSDMTVDLNGFQIAGPYCDPFGGDCASRAIYATAGQGQRVTVRNGILRSFQGNCIELGASSSIKGLYVSECLDGIVVGASSLVIENRVSNTQARGLVMGASTAYAHNVITGAGMAGPEAAVTGGTPTGGNVCDDGTCRSFGARRFYLTPTASSGGTSANRCAAGFHIAHLSEILDPSSLRYDSNLGYSLSGGGDARGAPFLVPGWVYHLVNHCSDYAGGGLGTSAQLTTGTPNIPNTSWSINGGDSCNTSDWRVWCVED